MNPTKKTLTATLTNGAIITRTTEKDYTHVVYCPVFMGADGFQRGGDISWASSLELAEKAADSMGYDKTFVRWNGGRRIYARAAQRGSTPVIVSVNA